KPPPDPLALLIDGSPNGAVPTPKVYVFDPEPPSAFPQSQRCYTPSDYVPDVRKDDVSRDGQSNIFTVLPSATYSFTAAATWSYAPIVAETPLTAGNIECQSLKSEQTLLATFNPIDPDGRYLAWPLIDPGAP